MSFPVSFSDTSIERFLGRKYFIDQEILDPLFYGMPVSRRRLFLKLTLGCKCYSFVYFALFWFWFTHIYFDLITNLSHSASLMLSGGTGIRSWPHYHLLADFANGFSGFWLTVGRNSFGPTSSTRRRNIWCSLMSWIRSLLGLRVGKVVWLMATRSWLWRARNKRTKIGNGKMCWIMFQWQQQVVLVPSSKLWVRKRCRTFWTTSVHGLSKPGSWTSLPVNMDSIATRTIFTLSSEIVAWSSPTRFIRLDGFLRLNCFLLLQEIGFIASHYHFAHNLRMLWDCSLQDFQLIWIHGVVVCAISSAFLVLFVL